MLDPQLCRRTHPRVPLLQQFGRDLTEQATRGELDPVIGRQAIIERVSHILLRRTKNNPLLLGDPGVGKTAIAEGMAHFMVQSQVSYMLAVDPRPISTSDSVQSTFPVRGSLVHVH